MLFAALAPFVAAQSCTPDLLIDDYRNAVQKDYDGALRYFNLVDADYGEVGIRVTYEPSQQRVTLVPTENNNFWFAKFNLQACFDLRGYTGIQFDIIAPPGGSATFTLTQQAPDCVTRLVDSVYTPLSRYITPNGQRQTVFQPLSDFATNLNGTAFDMQHLKDWTLVDLRPIGATFHISNFILKGNCNPVITSTSALPTLPTTNPTQDPAPVAPVAPATPTQSVKTSGSETTGIFGTLAAIALSLFA